MRTSTDTHSSRTFAAWLIVAAALALSPRALAATPAAGQQEPVPTPTLALSTKPPLGCCCVVDTADAARRRCGDGLSEAKCQAVARGMVGRVDTWTAGRCPGS